MNLFKSSKLKSVDILVFQIDRESYENLRIGKTGDMVATYTGWLLDTCPNVGDSLVFREKNSHFIVSSIKREYVHNTFNKLDKNNSYKLQSISVFVYSVQDYAKWLDNKGYL